MVVFNSRYYDLFTPELLNYQLAIMEDEIQIGTHRKGLTDVNVYQVAITDINPRCYVWADWYEHYHMLSKMGSDYKIGQLSNVSVQ